MPFLFEKLDVYRKAVDFAHEIGLLTESFGRGSGYLADQLRRAAVSVPANIAEGNGRRHLRDRRQFFYIARGSAFECVPLLELCVRRRLITDEQHEVLLEGVEDVARMLTGLASRAEKPRRGA